MEMGHLPEGLGSLTELQSLRLVDFSVSCLPRSLSQLSLLTELVVSDWRDDAGEGRGCDHGDDELKEELWQSGVWMPPGLLKALPALKSVAIEIGR